MALVEKQIRRPVEENRGHRYESRHRCHLIFLTKEQKTYDGEKTASSTNVNGKSDCPYARN
jgi:hypothetical protein